MLGDRQGDPPRNQHSTLRLSQDEFARLVDCHQRQLHAYLAGLLGHEEQAFDLVQETFFEAWQAAQKGSPPFLPTPDEAQVRRWLFRAGSNNAITLLRRRRLIRWESLEQVDAVPVHTNNGFEDRLAESEALRSALAQLAPRDVACLLLRVVHGFSAAEAGQILNTSAANVNNRLARAKQRLRAAYAGPQNDRQEAEIPR